MSIKIDFTKYVGTYSTDELKKVLSEMKSDIFEKEKEMVLIEVKERYGDKFNYEVMEGEVVDLSELDDNQSIVGCPIDGHYILMTERLAKL